MRTTVRLDDDLLHQAKLHGAEQGETLTAMIERGLRIVLSQQAQDSRRRRVRIPISKAKGGTRAGVSLDDTESLLDIMDGKV